MRIIVVGTSGAGKTTMAKRIASKLGLAHIELDSLHWEAGWQALTQTNPGEFIRLVSVAVSAENWVLDGNYGVVRKLVWSRGTHLIWLDYSRSVIMYRVITRSIVRAVNQTELWAGNTENWRRWLRPSHPITWAWTTWRRRRRQLEELLQGAEYKNLVVLRILRPREAAKVVDELRWSV